MDHFGQYNPGSGASSPSRYPLKWHKFLIYFALWFGAVVNAGLAISYMGGTVSTALDGALYARYGAMKTVDVINGAACLAIAVYMIYVRFQLAGFKIGAPRKLILVYTAVLILNLMYLLAVLLITSGSASEIIGQMVVQFIMSAILIFANQNYYSKRLELFVN